MTYNHLLKNLGLSLNGLEGRGIKVTTPIDGSLLAELKSNTVKQTETAIGNAATAFEAWRKVPAPQRGELIRIFGNVLRENKEPLAQLVTAECGKIIEEGRGEVQEMIDICDFAVGLSRQLYGLTIASERDEHVMSENWHPLGVVGVISAFNFPVAVWAWNFALAIVCGDPVVWKPSEKTPLTALACHQLFQEACKEYQDAPDHLSQVVIGMQDIGETLVNDPRVALVSATGSTRMGRAVGPQVAKRFGKSLLELGGNNAVIVAPSADLNIAIPSIVFGAVGTAGQRCTSTRRLFVHSSIYEDVWNKLVPAYESIAEKKIGDPLDKSTLVGPLIDEDSFKHMEKSIKTVSKKAKQIVGGGRVLEETHPDAFYAAPAAILLDDQIDVVCEETFAPILYVMPYDNLEDVMQKHNAVPQGLSSAIFTTDIREAEYFKQNSDCGIANVNIGTSGAEIGGAFGGEKETGGGRESGSDAWKNYMRRQTSTTYYGQSAPALAQGINFSLE